MNQEELLQVVDGLVEVPPGTLQGPENLEDLDGWNSMAMMGFISFADKNGIRLSPRQIAASTTVGDLIQLVQTTR
jgi:acyl carrier protein